MTKRMMRVPSEKVYRFCGPLYRCAYCGEPSDTIDHTTPRWFVSAHIELIQHYDMVKVSACRQCNLLAGAIVDRTWSARKSRIARKLATRAKKLLQTADWPDKELAEMGRMLRDYISQAQGDADVVRRRLAYLRDGFWPSDIPQELQIRVDQEDLDMEWLEDHEVVNRDALGRYVPRQPTLP